MAKLEIKVSNSLQSDVMKRAEEIAREGMIEGFANISGLGKLHKIYIEKKPGSTLMVLIGKGGNIDGKVIYLGVD